MENSKRYTIAFVFGSIFGALSLPIGGFIGLQVSSFLANILIFPALILPQFGVTPGESGGTILLTLATLVIGWGLVFLFVAFITKR